MANWIWDVKQYNLPKNAVKEPLKEQWIFSYNSSKKSASDTDKEKPEDEKTKEQNC